MTYLGFGDALVKLSLGLAGLTILLPLLGMLLRDRRLIDAGRNAMAAGGIAIAGAAACLVAGFFRGAYDIEYIYHYSERKLSAAKKFACLWAGLDGSILFWVAILGLIGTALAVGFMRRDSDPARRRLEPWVYVVFGGVQLFFLIVNAIVASPFKPVDPQTIAALEQAGLATRGMPNDGRGLNPLLDNYWMMIHPPSVYLGFILYTVPFAYGAAAMLSGEFSTAWIKATRGWTMLAWIFNTNGIILGGLWAYEVLGWGGYWAWDPVENASFLPWLTGTAFLHSVLVQERRDMLHVWNAFLVCATFVLSIFGTYLTRSGIVSSVHAFASGEVGNWFLAFLIGLIGISAFLVCLVWFVHHGRRTDRTIDNLGSREAVFVLNNFVLLAIAAAITILTLWPKISFEFMHRSISVGVPVYNRVVTPLFVVLFALTAIGPMLGWVRTSAGQFARNIVVPSIVSLVLTVLTQAFVWVFVRDGDPGDPFEMWGHVYPTGVVVFLGWLIVTSLAWELVRTVRNAAKGSGRDLMSAFVRLVTFQNRRYGGYLVHVGLGVIATGIVISSMYKIQREVAVAPGSDVDIGPYTMQVGTVQEDAPRKDQPYYASRVPVTIRRGEAEVASLLPEKRLYPRNGHRTEEVQTTDIEIARLRSEDFYVHYEGVAGDGRVRLTIHRNPCMWLVWIGWITMIVGGGFAAIPLGGRKVGLA